MTSRLIVRVACSRSCQVDAAGDDADVAERLREVADERAGGRVDLLRQQAERAGAGAQGRVQVLGSFEVTLQNQVVDQPEAAQQEGALVAGQAVG